MATFAVVVSLTTLVLWLYALVQIGRLRARLRGDPSGPGAAGLSGGELAQGAWAEELENKGQDILDRMTESETRLQTLVSRAETLQRELTRLEQRTASQRALEGEEPPAPVQREVAASLPVSKVAAVRRLASAGDDPVVIARKLGLGKGEVQLILNLQDS